MRGFLVTTSIIVAVFGMAVGFVACGDDTGETTLCDPGTEVFCKCRGGFEGTKTCNDDGATFGECTTPEGPCPEITETTTTDGVSMICTPAEVVECACDNGDPGTKTCASDGLSFGDCNTATGACGTTTTGDKLLYDTCASGSECQTGVCEGGYCTRSCEDFSVCVDEAEELYGDCVALEGGNVCAPYCTSQADCAGFGAESACGGASALDDPSLSFAACANWGADLHGMPYGTICDSETGELLFIETVIVMPCDIGLSGAQDLCLFGECSQACDVDDDCPEMDCSASGGNPGCCISDPECN